MISPAQVRHLVAAIPGARDDSSEDRLAFGCGERGFAWTFMQRDTPKQKRWPNLEVLAISCPLETKALLIEAAPDIYFNDPHYNGFPAVLTRLTAIGEDELAERLAAAVSYQMSRPAKRKKK
jgi:hypothetical protein